MAAKKTSKSKSRKSAVAKATRTAKKSASKKSTKKSTTKSTRSKKSGTAARAAKSVRSAGGASTNQRSKVGASGNARASSSSASKAQSANRKKAPQTAARAKDAPWEEQKELPKTKLTDKHLEEFRKLLLAKRRELTGDVRNLTQDALGRNRQDASGDLSSMPIHMADLGSDNWEQEFTLGLIANEQQLVREIDQALARIEDRTYGICMGTGKPITLARLRAKPWAKYCIEYARQRELGRI